ncbi:hypothetical protein GCM10023189_59060 [Nibrella saemangeumensis]|uniref:VRR-NUC domain-containing protein n=1 Tax=Nibrella saemangeumensis TaxID=1084526 RepID=A0ABP8NST8_9BACT
MNQYLQELIRLDLEAKRLKCPNVPAFAIKPTKYSDKTANDLTRAIIRCIELYGGYAVRVQTQGQFNEKLGRWTKGTTKTGTADIHGIYNGQHLSIEVKIGRDRQSEAQRRTADQVSRSGGLYFIAKDFESFWQWFHAIDANSPTNTAFQHQPVTQKERRPE